MAVGRNLLRDVKWLTLAGVALLALVLAVRVGEEGAQHGNSPSATCGHSLPVLLQGSSSEQEESSRPSHGSLAETSEQEDEDGNDDTETEAEDSGSDDGEDDTEGEAAAQEDSASEGTEEGTAEEEAGLESEQESEQEAGEAADADADADSKSDAESGSDAGDYAAGTFRTDGHMGDYEGENADDALSVFVDHSNDFVSGDYEVDDTDYYAAGLLEKLLKHYEEAYYDYEPSPYDHDIGVHLTVGVHQDPAILAAAGVNPAALLGDVQATTGKDGKPARVTVEQEADPYDYGSSSLLHVGGEGDKKSEETHANLGKKAPNLTSSPPMVDKLCKASKAGDIEEVHSLLTGVDPDGFSHDGTTALYLASSKGHIKVVEALLEAGANPDIGKGTKTPMIVALKKGHKQVFEALDQVKQANLVEAQVRKDKDDSDDRRLGGDDDRRRARRRFRRRRDLSADPESSSSSSE